MDKSVYGNHIYNIFPFFNFANDPRPLKKTIQSLEKKVSLLFDKSNQFNKLSRTDRLTCLSVLEDNPKDLEAVVNYICQSYGSKIDTTELLNELRNFHHNMLTIDREFSNKKSLR